VDEKLAAEFKDATRQLISAAQKHAEDSKSLTFDVARSKSTLSSHCKTLYRLLAQVTTQQHLTFAQELRSKFIIYGTLVDVGIQHSLVSFGSEPVQTSQEYLWNTGGAKATAQQAAASSSTTAAKQPPAASGPAKTVPNQPDAPVKQPAPTLAAKSTAPTKQVDAAKSEQGAAPTKRQPEATDRGLPVLGQCASCSGEIRGKVITALVRALSLRGKLDHR
jgi:hypothetical protein